MQSTNHIIHHSQVRRATTITILTYIIVGAVSYMPGIFSVSLAASLAGQDTGLMVNLGTAYLVGRVLGYFSSAIIVKWLGGRKAIAFNLFILGLTTVATAMMGWIHGGGNDKVTWILTVYTLAIFVGGWAGGNCRGASSYLIIATYKSRGKTTLWINIIEGIYGIAAALMAFSKSILKETVQNDREAWTWVYLAVTIFLILIAGFVYLLKLEENNDYNSLKNIPKIRTKIKDYRKNKKLQKKSFFANSANWLVILGGIGMLLYSYGEKNSTFYWPYYFDNTNPPKIDLPLDDAANLIGIFWIFCSIGRLTVGLVLSKRMRDTTILYCLVAVSVVGYGLFLGAEPLDSAALFYIGAIIIGLGLSGIYPTIISYSYRQTTHVSSVTSGLLSGLANLGGMICTLVSPDLATGTNSKLMPTVFALGCFFVILGIIIFINWWHKHQYQKESDDPILQDDLVIIKEMEDSKIKATKT